MATPAQRSSLGSLIFLSRWLQVPLYLGLIVAQAIYVWQFMLELWHIFEALAHGHGRGADHAGRPRPRRRRDDRQPADHGDRRRLRDVRVPHQARRPPGPAGVALARQRERAEDQAGDVDHRHLVDPPAARASSRPARSCDDHGYDALLWQTIIHLAFIVSAVALAWIDKMSVKHPPKAVTAPSRTAGPNPPRHG